MDMPGFIEYCARHDVGAELTSYFFPPDCDASYFTDCRRIAHVNGVQIAGTAVGNNFSHPKDAPERAEQIAYVKTWIDNAVLMGAPHVRVFAGAHPKGVSPEEAENNAIEALAETAVYAGEKGVFLGIENHDSITTADRLLRIVRGVESPWVGVNLDSGNFIADDVYAEMTASAPYSINVQLKTEIKVKDSKENSRRSRARREDPQRHRICRTRHPRVRRGNRSLRERPASSREIAGLVRLRMPDGTGAGGPWNKIEP
jgi:Sugar phosphate isomerases/epimerases